MAIVLYWLGAERAYANSHRCQEGLGVGTCSPVPGIVVDIRIHVSPMLEQAPHDVFVSHARSEAQCCPAHRGLVTV
jgi:hypothetical protein